MGDAGPEEAEAQDPLIGASLDGYAIEERIGHGGMGVVYRAIDMSLKRTVAVKTLFIAAANPETRQRFDREARLAAGVSHPNVVPVFDFGAAEGHLYIVMELIAGPDLAKLLDGGALPEERALGLLSGIASGLQKIHSVGLVHRDIKPSNVLVQDVDKASERAMITDFGIARAVEGQTSLTFGPIGTPDYMAPETTVGQRATEQADQYSLALILYEMLAGEHLFVGHEMPTAHREEPVPNLDERLPAVPAGIRAALARALEKDPAKRFSSVEAFAEAVSRKDAPGAAVALERVMEDVLSTEYPRGLVVEELVDRVNARVSQDFTGAQIEGRAELYPQLFRRRPDGRIALRRPPS